MKRLLYIILILGGSLACSAQSGTGWIPSRVKQNVLDSIYFNRDARFNSTVRINENALRIGLVTMTANGTELNILDGALVNTTELNQLVGVTGKTGTGNLVLSNSPTLTTPNLGTPSAIILTNATGTAASLTAGAVTGYTPASGSLTLSGADAITFTTTNVTSLTLPTSGTLATTTDAALGKVYSDTMSVSAGVLRTKATTITTEPYSVQIFSSGGKDITHAVADSVALDGGVYKLYVYSVDALTGAKIKILY